MMWFDYTTTHGVLIHYMDLNGIERSYSQNFTSPSEVIKIVAMLAHDNQVKEVTCAGIAYQLVPAIKQELLKTYNNESINFIEGE